jgi:endonuclease/exonuclease/phosphatase (EEP) superfamily protein YafD
LRVASINLLRYLNDVDYAAQVMEGFDADILSVQEITPVHAEVLTPRLSAKYPYQLVHADAGFNGVAIYSKYPLRLEEDGLPEGLRWLRAAVEVQGREVAFYAIHLAPPHTIRMQKQNRWQVGRLMRQAKAESRPTILAGDFNATYFTPQMAALRKAGFVDAHFAAPDVASGRGTTWPTPVGPRIVPAVRIDTVLTRGAIAATSSRVGPKFGSDHWPIVVGLSLTK